MKATVPLYERPAVREALEYLVFLIATLLAIAALSAGCNRVQVETSSAGHQEWSSAR